MRSLLHALDGGYKIVKTVYKYHSNRYEHYKPMINEIITLEDIRGSRRVLYYEYGIEQCSKIAERKRILIARFKDD